MTSLLPNSSDLARARSKKGVLTGATILIGEPLDTSAAATRATLRREGAEDVIWRRTMKGVKEALTKGGVDLALVDTTLPDGDAVELARQVRFGGFDDNPFLPLMITTWRPEGPLITAALAAGADDVLAKPISALQIAKRVSRIARDRKPFIATQGYIGPVRADMAQEAKAARSFEAPNRLKALATGEASMGAEQQAMMKQARLHLTVARLEINLRDLSREARSGLAATSTPNADPTTRAAMRTCAQALRQHLAALPVGALQSAVQRLAALAELAAGGGKDALKAAALTADIADAVAMIIMHRDNENLDLPPDIISRIDSRFPELAAA